MNRTLISLFLSFLAIKLISAESLCGIVDPNPILKGDDNHPICIVINGTSKIEYYPLVDEFSLIEIDGSFGLSALVNASIQVEIKDMSTPLITYHNPEKNMIIPFFTIIIKLDNGRVVSVDWDNGCFTCDSVHCIDEQCALDYDDCSLDSLITPDLSDCDVKVYVSWIGTDADGDELVSASKRISRFREYSLYDVYTSAKANAEDTLGQL